MQTKLKSLIAQGEGINIEFKESKNKMNGDGDFNITGRDAQVSHLYLLKPLS